MTRPFIAIVGSVEGRRTDYKPPLRNVESAPRATQELGRELAKAGYGIIVYSSDPAYIEADVVRGYVASNEAKEQSIQVRYPIGAALATFPEQSTHPALFDDRPDKHPNWEVSFYMSLKDADGILLMGGANSAFITGLVAQMNRIPLVSIATFGGSAETVWGLSVESLVTEEERKLMGAPTWREDAAARLVQILGDQRARLLEEKAGNASPALSPEGIVQYVDQLPAKVFSSLEQLLRKDVPPGLDLGGVSSTRDVNDLLAEFPSLQTRVKQALQLAKTLSLQVGFPLDSLMVLAVWLNLASGSRRSDSDFVVLNTLREQHKSKDVDVATLLGLSSVYPTLDGIPTEPASSYGSFGVTDELYHVLKEAHTLAQEMTGNGRVLRRLVLSVVFSPQRIQPLPRAQQHLQEHGFNLEQVRKALLAYDVRMDPDNRTIWEDLLNPSETVEGVAEEALLSAGYVSDRVDPNAPDRLGIMPEVQTICRVLASRAVTPPLSLGLFGDWGSGKSFFMAKMRKEIDNIAFTAHQEQSRSFCSSVVQIEFNAWHFADANLWASLVSHIFDELFEKLSKADSEETIKKRLKEELKQAKGLMQEATRALSNAESGVEQAEQVFQEAKADREEKEENFLAINVINDVKALLADDKTVRDELEEASKKLGYPEAASTYDALQETTGELRSFSKRTAAIGQLFIGSPFTFVAIPFLIIVLLFPLVVEYLLEAFPATFEWVNASIAEVSTFVTGVVVWVGTQIKRVAPLMQKIEDAYKKAQTERERRQRDEVAPQQRALDLAREREQVAQQTLQEAQVKLQKIEHELVEFSPGRQLYRLIEERGRDDRYSQHLGIISLIRKDFERMSKHLHDLSDQDLKPGEEPPLQRIILYIDDLDRCRAQRVVEVLEAIHLLLAFPLFVVVVGVDPRWLRRCLELHHKDLFSDSVHRADEPEPDQAPLRTSTPQDYLEKIFQIPYALRPIGPDGYRQFIGDLLTPLDALSLSEAAAIQREERATGDGAIDSKAQPPVPVEKTPGDGEAEGEEPVIGEEKAQVEQVESSEPIAPPTTEPVAPGSQTPEPEEERQEEDREREEEPEQEQEQEEQRQLVPLNPHQLVFTDKEQEDIKRMASLFRTPRAVKRFVNIYRMLRVGLDPGEIDDFLGTDEQPGQYRVALVLLAVVTAFPNLAPHFLQRLNWWLPKPWEQRKTSSWDDFLDTLELPREEVEKHEGATNWKKVATERGEAGKAEADVPEVAWRKLCETLREVAGKQDKESFLPFEEDVLKDWARRVARYSFSFNLHEIV